MSSRFAFRHFRIRWSYNLSIYTLQLSLSTSSVALLELLLTCSYTYISYYFLYNAVGSLDPHKFSTYLFCDYFRSTFAWLVSRCRHLSRVTLFRSPFVSNAHSLYTCFLCKFIHLICCEIVITWRWCCSTNATLFFLSHVNQKYRVRVRCISQRTMCCCFSHFASDTQFKTNKKSRASA